MDPAFIKGALIRIKSPEPDPNVDLTPMSTLERLLSCNGLKGAQRLCYDASLRCIGDAQLGGDHESDHIEKSAAGN